jgi:hypothetical protein
VAQQQWYLGLCGSSKGIGSGAPREPAWLDQPRGVGAKASDRKITRGYRRHPGKLPYAAAVASGAVVDSTAGVGVSVTNTLSRSAATTPLTSSARMNSHNCLGSSPTMTWVSPEKGYLRSGYGVSHAQ